MIRPSDYAMTPQQRRALQKDAAAQREASSLARLLEHESNVATETAERNAHIIAARSIFADCSLDEAKPTTPPSCNTGGTGGLPLTQLATPRTPQGCIDSQKTIIDTISWSIPTENSASFPSGADEAQVVFKLKDGTAKQYTPAHVRRLLAYILDQMPAGCEIGPVTEGSNGYPRQAHILSGSLVLGWLAWGAIHGKQWLYLTGTGLRHRRDHGMTDDALVVFCDLDGARLGRIDIALDLYDHATFSVDRSIYEHATGGYKLERAPGNPHSEVFQSDTKCHGYEVARTHYIGRRTATKRLRCYDKGLQLLGTMTSEELDYYRRLGVVRTSTVPDDRRLEEWTRVELIYKHDKQRPIGAQEILRRDQTFAGAYPILANLLDRSDGIRPSYIPKDEDCELAKLIAAGKMSYGGLMYHLRYERGWSDTEIVEAMMGTKSAARLMVDHETPD